MNIFSSCSPQVKEIGEYFVQKLFAIIQNYKYYNGSTILNSTDLNNQASEDLYSCLKLAQQKAQNSKKIELIEELILFESKSLPTLSKFNTPQALQPLKSILNTFLLSEKNLKHPSSIAQIFENLSKTNFISQKHNGHLQQILHLFNYEQLITFLNRPEDFQEQLKKESKKLNKNLNLNNKNNDGQIPEPIAKLFQIILEKKIKNHTQKQLFTQLFDFVFVFNLKDPLLSIGQKMLQYYNTTNNGNNQQIINTFGIISLSLFSNFQKITMEQSQIFILYMFNILGLIETNQFQKEINTYKIQENAEKLLEFNGNVQKSKILNGISFIGTCSKAIDQKKAQKYLQNFIMNNIVKKGGPLIQKKENQAEDDKQKIQAIGQLFLCMFVQFSDFFRNDQDKIIEIIQKAEFTIKEFAQEKIDFFQITCDIIFVSFDILKNKNILSTKQVLEKYSNNFHRYFKMLNNITSSFLSEGDEELKFFIDFLIDSLEKFIFTDTTNLKEELITQFAQNIGTLFKRIIFQSLNTQQNKQISYFNNDQTSFNTYKKALRDYTKLENTYHEKKLQINALKLNLQETSIQKNQHTQNLNTFYQRYGQLDSAKLFKNGPEEIPNPSLNPNLNPNVNPNANPNANPNDNPNLKQTTKAKQNLNKYSAHLNQISHLSFYQKYLSQLEKETQNIENQQIKTNFSQVIEKFKIQLKDLKQFFDQKEVKNFSLNLNLDDSFLPEKDKSDANQLQQQQNELISQLEEIVNEIIFNFKINFHYINQFDPTVYEKTQDTSFLQQLEFQIFYGIQIFDVKQQLRNLEIFAEKAQLKITNLVQKQLNSEAKKIEKLKNLAKLDPKIDKILSKTDFIIQKIVQIQKIYAQKLSPLIEDFDINGFDFAIFINKFVPEIVQLANFDPDSSQANVFIQNVTNSIICLINCQFDQIHDDLFQINMKMNDPSFNQFNKIKEKIEEQGLQPREIFKLADLDGGGTLDMREFQLYFKKIGIDLSEHRVNEIFAQAKKASPQIQQSSEQHLDEEEFIKAYEYVLSYSMILTLEKMGITRTKLTIILIYLVVILLLIFLFIFVGVAAFAIPGAFGAMINSLFPIMGGTGLSKANNSKSEKKKDFTKIKETIKESLATIQNTDI
ncbi:hypothetical protein PPERSA_00154 [Pseudocohnilembus persalinus]|uniref:EF-hand domain-containing protein n=1 Tax=Pseudocohnilembus persalinus TaxID=266149 RepID=A0A0V0QID2_PSEPJ|nr:hypothetical protein PPERSA_00154 [Pseudocohnilembus persalinus]|eukprot:KRX01781.1 hypothetical protein PPERSA_00154 [Pseudocohnilembus persalinus]